MNCFEAKHLPYFNVSEGKRKKKLSIKMIYKVWRKQAISQFFWTKINTVLVCSLILASNAFSQEILSSSTKIDHDLLNAYILEEVNKLRQKVKVEPLVNDVNLLPPAEDHTQYLIRKEKLSHYQRFNWKKKNPKNRVDFYGYLFAIVGENIQQTNLKAKDEKATRKTNGLHTYKTLAEELVDNWEHSPPHYKNMISPDFQTTNTAIVIKENGEIYACQLFGGSRYFDKYEKERPKIKFKRLNESRCLGCRLRPPTGELIVSEKGEIYFFYARKPRLKLMIFASRMRFFNPWRDGLAADIIVKSQYPCDSSSYFNGQAYVRGFSLTPVYRKNFGFMALRGTSIYLGKVPDFIEEDYEVNLVVIQNKRPCSNTLYYQIPSTYYVDIPLKHEINKSYDQRVILAFDSLSYRLNFEKSQIEPMDLAILDSTWNSEINKKSIYRIELDAHASIEGSKQMNELLYQKRAAFLLTYLAQKDFDTSLVHVVMTENFSDFRKDIVNTPFQDLNLLSDEELKIKLMNPALSDSLEGILKNHRYVQVNIKTADTTYLDYTKETLYPLLRKSIKEENRSEIAHWQEIEFGLIEKGKISKSDMLEINIPYDKKFVNELCNRAIMRFQFDTLYTDSLIYLRNTLEKLAELKVDKKLTTSIAIIDYQLWKLAALDMTFKKFYNSISKNKLINPEIQARILLNMGSMADWGLGPYRRISKYYYPKVMKYIDPARLDVDKTFEIASYYSYFKQDRFAFNLVRNKIDETKNPDDLIYFLKLIYLLDVKLPKSTIIRYFKKIREYSGNEFCTYFNNPALNFQILDDLEIKEIYCEECAEKNEPNLK